MRTSPKSRQQGQLGVIQFRNSYPQHGYLLISQRTAEGEKCRRLFSSEYLHLWLFTFPLDPQTVRWGKSCVERLTVLKQLKSARMKAGFNKERTPGIEDSGRVFGPLKHRREGNPVRCPCPLGVDRMSALIEINDPKFKINGDVITRVICFQRRIIESASALSFKFWVSWVQSMNARPSTRVATPTSEILTVYL